MPSVPLFDKPIPLPLVVLALLRIVVPESVSRTGLMVLVRVVDLGEVVAVSLVAAVLKDCGREVNRREGDVRKYSVWWVQANSSGWLEI